MRSRSRIICLGAITCALLGALAWWGSWLLPGSRPPPLPDPNGYDDFIRAGRMLEVDVDFEKASLKELELMVASNAPALAVWRAGLEKESRVPLGFTPADMTAAGTQLPFLKAIAFAASAEARLELTLHRPEEAAEICVEIIRFGIEGCWGGVLLHRVVGYRVEHIGSEILAETYPELDACECRRIINQLADVLERRQPLDEVRATELTWVRSVSGLQDWATGVIQVRSFSPFEFSAGPSLAMCKQLEAEAPRLLLDIASHTYTLEQGHPPESATNLVPDYLKTVPMDPVTGDPLELDD